jgi:allantoinase
MHETVFKSRKVLLPEGLKAAQVIVANGIIKDVVPYNATVDGTIIELEDQLLLPGVIDPHVHINEPGRTEWEGFDTATKAAITGGITTVVDMPLNASPVTTTVAAFREKLQATAGQLHTNCGFWGGLVPGNAGDIEGLIHEGVLGFKAFLTHSGIDEFPNVTEEDLRKAMPLIAKHGLPLLVHCELSEENDDWKKDNKKSYQHYLFSRPHTWEDKAIELMIQLCEEFHCPVHIVHLSSADSIPQIQKAKEKGLPLTVETAQHYLYFHAEEIQDGQTVLKCAPPIREKANNDLLWEVLQSGIIDFVATDHSPAPPQLKQVETGDFTTAWGGIASLQFALPVLWTAARKRGIAIEQVVKWLCEKPALLIGKKNSKGKIAKGYDADLIVFDAEATFTVTGEIIRHKHKITPYLNHKLHGVVEQTYLGGVKVCDAGTLIQPDQGKVITI